MTPKLRDYQELGIKLIGQEIAKGNKAVCFVMATGLGKTTTASELCRRHLAKVPHGKILWMVHREELVTQAYDELTLFGLSCGVIMASPTRTVNPYRRVQVASIQTMIARKIFLDDITLVIHDEAHHGPSASWATLPNTYKARGAIIIGPTATPIRGDLVGLGDIYDALVQPISTRRAIERGFLVPYDFVRPPFPLKNDEIAQSPVDAYQENCPGEKAIVFAAHIVAATKFVEEFNAAGISAVLVTGKTPSEERREKLAKYKSGFFRVLVNVGIATEGFNDPPTSCVILARSVGSIGFYLQTIGRGLRPCNGKKRLMIIDLHGSSWIHEEPDKEHDWQLEGEAIKKPGQVNPERFCAGCGVLLDGDATICDLCQEARPELVPPTVLGIKLVKYAAKLKEDPTKRAETLARWIMMGQAKGWKYGAAFHKYKAVYQIPPDLEITTMAKAIIKAKREKEKDDADRS